MPNAYKKQLKDKNGDYIYPVIAEGGTAMSEGDYRLDTYANADGIVVPSGANLNTLEYLKVGKYVCKTDAIAGSIVNRPGTTVAWTMTVKNPLDNTHDDETARGYVYRVREVTNRYGSKWVQSVESGATAGSFTYSAWRFVTMQPISNTYNITANSALVSAINTKAVNFSGMFAQVDLDLTLTATGAQNYIALVYGLPKPLQGCCFTGLIWNSNQELPAAGADSYCSLQVNGEGTLYIKKRYTTTAGMRLRVTLSYITV